MLTANGHTFGTAAPPPPKPSREGFRCIPRPARSLLFAPALAFRPYNPGDGSREGEGEGEGAPPRDDGRPGAAYGDT